MNQSIMNDHVHQSSSSSSHHVDSRAGCSSYGSPHLMSTVYEEGEGGGGESNECDIVPTSRDRCNTWPMRRPTLDHSNHESFIHDDMIPEEKDELSSNDQLNVSNLSVCDHNDMNHLNESSSTFSPGDISSPTSGCSSLLFNGLDVPPTSKKGATRRNAWGNMSYADLITQAILQSPEKRLTLSQVYEWMVQNIPYFRDKGDSNSSAGWKNSIRHNLSLHSRFMRIQNEGAGKSSWWVINPDAKPGRNPRRQRASTMDTSSKSVIDKKRRGARKKVMDLRVVGGSTSALSVSSSGVGGSNSSILSHDPFNTNTNDDSINSPFDALYRARASSTSVTTGMRSGSPIEHFDDFDFPPWVDSATNNPSIPSDIVDRTDHIRLDASRVASNVLGREIKQEMKVIKNEPGVAPPPSYQELSSVRGPQQHLQNPLLRGQLTQMKTPTTGLPSYLGGSYGWSTMTLPSHSCGASVSQVSVQSSLPIDLENLTLPDQPLIDMDMESILRHELSQTTNNQLNFDI